MNEQWTATRITNPSIVAIKRERGLGVDFTSGWSLEQRSGAAGRRRTGEEEEADLDGEEEDPTREHQPHHRSNRRRCKKMSASTEYPRSAERRCVEADPRRGDGEEARRGRKLPRRTPALQHRRSLMSMDERRWRTQRWRKETQRRATAAYKGGRFHRWGRRAEVSPFSRKPTKATRHRAKIAPNWPATRCTKPRSQKTNSSFVSHSQAELPLLHLRALA
jgi:hypothetical protein